MNTKITEIKKINTITRTARDENGESYEQSSTYESYEVLPLVTGMRRFCHHVVDALLAYGMIFIILFPIAVLLAARGIYINQFFETMGGKIVDRLITALSLPLYYILFESTMQTTPGKLLTGSIVVNEYGEKPDFMTIVKRSYSRIVPFEAFTCLSEDRGWHDIWSDTFVVNKMEFEKLLLNQQINEMGAV